MSSLRKPWDYRQAWQGDSVEVQEAHNQSQDVRLVFGAVVSARHDIARSGGILLDIAASSQHHDTNGGDTYDDAKPPGYAVPVYSDSPPTSQESSDLALVESTFPPSDTNGNVVALCQAAAVGNVSQIQAFLAEGTNINGRNDRGETAIICAIRAGQLDSVQTLLASGADTSCTDSGSKGRPSLFHAIDRQSRATIELLLESSITAPTRARRTSGASRTCLSWCLEIRRRSGSRSGSPMARTNRPRT